MKTLALAFLIETLIGSAVWADAPKQPVPVDVRLTGDDGLTQDLLVSLQDGLRKHRYLRLAHSSAEAVLTIRSDTNVGWDKLGGRVVVIYSVYIDCGDTQSQPLTGICYESAMSKCVKDILRIAALSADAL